MMNRNRTILPLVLVLSAVTSLAGCGGPVEDTAGWHFTLGNQWAEQTRYDKAIEEYDEAISLNPADADMYNNRGIAYYKLDQFEKAMRDYDEAIRINPEHALAYYNRGVVNKKQGERAKAIADFEQLIILTENPQWIAMAKKEIERLRQW